MAHTATTTITTAEATRRAAAILAQESRRFTALGRVDAASAARVALAWRVIEVAGRAADPKATRRDQFLTVLGLERDDVYGGARRPGFAGGTSAVVTGTR